MPTATYTLGNVGTGASGLCFLFGSQIPFSSAKLKQMYPTHDAYVKAFRYDAGIIQAEGFLRPQEAYEADLAAQSSKVP